MVVGKRARQASLSPHAVEKAGEQEEREDSWLRRDSLESPAGWSSTKKSRFVSDVDDDGLVEESASALSKSFHLEESLIIAEGNRDRYKIELEAELDRSANLAGRLAELEAENARLANDAKASAAKVVAKERELKAEAVARESERRKSVLEAVKLGSDEEKLKLEGEVRGLKEALSKAEEERDLAKEEAAAAVSKASLLNERLEEAQKEASANTQSFLVQKGSSAEDAAGRQKIADLETIIHHQSSALETAKAEVREIGELRKTVKRLRDIEAEATEAKERVHNLETMVRSMVEAEAKLRQERDGLQDWKVTLAVGMREASTPSDVIEAFKALREANLQLEAQLAAGQERAKHKERETKESEEKRAEAESARKRAEEERDALRSELIEEKGRVERAAMEGKQLRLMLDSFKVEEVLVRDLSVQDLKKKVAEMEAKQKQTAAEMESERSKAKASDQKLQGEVAKVKEELAKATADLTKTKEDLQKSRSEVTTLKEQVRKDGTAAALEKRRAQKEKEEVEKQLEEEKKATAEAKGKVEEAEKEVKTAKEKIEKVQAEMKEKTEKVKKFSDAMIKDKKKHEDFERVFPYLFGFSYKYQAGTVKAKDGQEAPKDRLLVISLKTSFSEKPHSFMIKAVVPPESDATPTVQIQESALPESLQGAKDKYVTASVQTAAKHAGLPAFLASLVDTDFERLVKQKKKEEAESKKEPADGTVSPVLAAASAQAPEARARSKSPVLL